MLPCELGRNIHFRCIDIVKRLNSQYYWPWLQSNLDLIARLSCRLGSSTVCQLQLNESAGGGSHKSLLLVASSGRNLSETIFY